MTQKKSKVLTFFMILFVIPLLSGCVKLNMDLQVNNDKTLSGTMIFAVADSLAAMGTGSSDFKTNDLISGKAKGVTVTEYKSGGYTGAAYKLDHVPFSEISKGIGENGIAGSTGSSQDGLKFKQVGNKVYVTGNLDMTNSNSSDPSDPFAATGESIAKSMMSAMDLRISIRVPGKVIKTTGELSTDGKTISWHPKYGEKNDLATEIEIPSGSSLLMPILFVALALIGGVVFLFIKRKQSEDEAAEGDDGASW